MLKDGRSEEAPSAVIRHGEQASPEYLLEPEIKKAS